MVDLSYISTFLFISLIGTFIFWLIGWLANTGLVPGSVVLVILGLLILSRLLAPEE